MHIQLKQVSLMAGLAFVLAASLQLSTSGPVQAASPPLQNESPVQDERPFQLPFAEPPGLDTWLMAQPYGNTTGAYNRRFTTYGASGGIHFGLDLAAPCGTEVVAVADGVVFAVDGPFGSPPHNLMIDHPRLGYASMYGHLLEPPALVPGQEVKQGQVIALSGDSEELCYRRPHLHLEIRDLNHIRKYNPQLLIEANWDNLAMTGSSGREFTRDLDEPRKWQTLYDQPEAQTGGPILNDFANPWPLDWHKRSSSPVTPASLTISASSQPQTSTVSLASLPFGRQISRDSCCTNPYWSQDSSQVRFIDRPAPESALGFWGIDLAQPDSGPQLVSERLGIYSPDGALMAYPDRNKGLAVIERLADGRTVEINTQERRLSFTPDSQQVIWVTYDEEAPSDNRMETLWLAGVDGSNARILLRAQRTDSVAWLSATELLLARRIGGSSDEQLFTLSLADGRQTDLMTVPRMRGLALSPDSRYLVYYASLEAESSKNGVWLIDLQNPEQPPRKLPFFGSYRWRDAQRLIYVPFEPDAVEHLFYEYDVVSGQTRSLFPEGTGLTIANNDWQVSPDGSRIALVAAAGTRLDGIWVLDISQD